MMETSKQTIIESNIGKEANVHDNIMYPSLEKQVFDLFKYSVFENVSYRIDGPKKMLIYVDNFKLEVVISKNIKIKMQPTSSYDDYGFKFGFGEYSEQDKIYPSATFTFNKDITKKINDFISQLQKLTEIYKKAEPIAKWASDKEKIIADKIINYLTKKLTTDDLAISFWLGSNRLFDGHEISFYIHPKDKAPADGIVMCFEHNTHQLNTWYNKSTPTRSSYNNMETVSDIVKKMDFESGVIGMKSKIKLIEQLEENIKNFKLEGCIELVELIDKKEQANKILKELRDNI